MEFREEIPGHLGRLIIYLGGRRDHILEEWRRATLLDPKITTASTLTRVQFHDHIPGVLDAFTRRLASWPGQASRELPSEDKEQVIGHGLQRWQQGYLLHEVTGEWGQLQICLMEELESFAGLEPVPAPGAMRVARNLLSRLCWEGISESSNQYWRLHQAEAASQALDLEQALATLNDLERARAEAWREAAHDLRGSVNIVEGAASVLQSDRVPEPVRAKFFNMLQSGVSSLHAMLVDLMSLARLEAGQEQRQIESFDAATLITEFGTNSMPLAHERGLYLKLEGPESLVVAGDKIKVQRILQNLLLNGLKYTKRGGVTVAWSAVDGQTPPMWMFYVQDTGPGLDAGLGTPITREVYEATRRSQDTDPSSPADAETVPPVAPTLPAESKHLPADHLPGEGIGLSIVKRLCDLLDASLELETSHGTGSTFRVTLPMAYHTKEAPR